MIGGGMVRLVELASGGKGDQGLLLQGLLKFYGSRMVGDSRAYPGVHSLLSSLRLAGIGTGIVSNKAHGMTVDVVSRIFPGAAFKVILGHRPGYLKKPDPSVLLEACDVGGMTVSNTLFVGDTTVDMEAAIRAGMGPIGVSWGYHSASRLEEAGAVHILKDGHDLRAFGTRYAPSWGAAVRRKGSASTLVFR